MTMLTVIPDLEQQEFIDWKRAQACNRKHGEGTVTGVGLMRNGTKGGKAVVMFRIEQPDGSQVIGQTTWALLRTAYGALAATPIVAEEVIDP